MEEIYIQHLEYINNLDIDFRRNTIDSIDWNNRLIAIKGARGVGKSTMILQHIKETFDQDPAALYVSMDDISINGLSILDLAKGHINFGGTHLFIDEIHKYQNWSQELKNIHDKYKKLHVVVTSSSILKLYQANHDLSRRMVSYDLPGLSFREYLNIENGTDLPTYSLQDLLSNHTKIATEISEQITILPQFSKYLQHGYYPFYLEGQGSYLHKLNNTINLILDVDLPYVMGVSIPNIFKIKKLLSNLAKEVPFQPNISKLAGSLELTRSTLNQYIHYLDSASLLNLLFDAGKSYSMISKPEKVFLDNTNLSYAIAPRNVNTGNIRETFFFNQVSKVHNVTFTKTGDFLVDEKYTFEIGGKNKNKKQIWNVENSYIAADNLRFGTHNKIPVWLFGFLY